MNFSFNDSDIKKISTVLNHNPDSMPDTWVWHLKNEETAKPMVVSLHNCVDLDSDTKGVLISVQTRHGYYELHNITGYMIFEPDEVIFISNEKKTVSSLIIGKENSCSLYSNIRKEILNADFTELDPAVLLSAMQLSIAESLL